MRQERCAARWRYAFAVVEHTRAHGEPCSCTHMQRHRTAALTAPCSFVANTLGPAALADARLPLPHARHRKGAEEERKEKEARKAEKAAIDAKRLERARELKDAARLQFERDKQIKKEDQQAKLAVGQGQRAKEAEWQEKREKSAADFAKKGRTLVEETRQRQKKMDKAEASQDKLEREEGTRDRLANMEAFKKEKAAVFASKKEKVQKVKKMTDPSIIAESKQWASQQRVGSAEDKRRQVAMLKSQRRRGKESHLENAKAVKANVEQIRENAKAVQARLNEKKKENAAGERANDYLVEQEKLRVLAQKKQDHKEVYRKRYASAKAAATWEQTPTLAKPNLSSLDPSVSGGLMG